MRRRLLLVPATAAALLAAAPGSEAARTRTRAPLKPPVITEPFTPLPCSGRPGSRTTLEQEGCAEQYVLHTDGRIDGLVRTVFSLLPDAAARKRFVTAERAWLAYRRADCASVSDVFEGGTQAPVLFAQCEGSRNDQRIRDLRTLRGELSA